MRFTSKLRKELKEWGIFAAIIAVLYFTGWHTEVSGFMQRIILSTGAMQPNIEQNDQVIQASYAISLRNLNTNEVVNLDRSKGKVVFMNYWATWCPPCIAEMPNIQSLYNNMKEEDVDFYLITVDENLEKAKKFIERKEYSFPVYTIETVGTNMYKSGSIPTTYIIDKAGKLAVTHKGMADYDNDSFKSFLRGLNDQHHQ